MIQLEITQLNNRYKKDQEDKLRIHKSQNMKSNQLKDIPSHDIIQTGKTIIPVKEYSNKFLRESASMEKKENNSRISMLVSKHKHYQKKYQKVLGKKHQVCKTEPNQNEYQCFTTGNNFYKEKDREPFRVKTQNMIDKNYHMVQLSHNQPSILGNVLSQEVVEESYEGLTDLNRVKVDLEESEKGTKLRYDGMSFVKKDEKISTSRALELFSRIVSRDRGDLIQKLKICNQKKLLKQKLMESSKNLEAKQMKLVQKAKKFSVVERGERRCSIKTHLKYKYRKTSEAHKVYKEEDNFEIKGWDYVY